MNVPPDPLCSPSAQSYQKLLLTPGGFPPALSDHASTEVLLRSHRRIKDPREGSFVFIEGPSRHVGGVGEIALDLDFIADGKVDQCGDSHGGAFLGGVWLPQRGSIQ